MTAVEWLQSQIVFESVDKELLARWDEDSDLSEYFEQAKEMEKQQIIKAVYHTCSAMSHSDIPCGEQYYNELNKSE